MNRTMIRVALGTAALSAGLAVFAGPASAAQYGTSSYLPLPAASSGTLKLICPSYATHMLLDTVKLTPKAGVTVTGTTYLPNNDVFHRDYLLVDVTNTSAVASGITAAAYCQS